MSLRAMILMIALLTKVVRDSSSSNRLAREDGDVRPIAKLTIKPMRRFKTGLLGGHSRDLAAACVHYFSSSCFVKDRVYDLIEGALALSSSICGVRGVVGQL